MARARHWASQHKDIYRSFVPVRDWPLSMRMRIDTLATCFCAVATGVEQDLKAAVLADRRGTRLQVIGLSVVVDVLVGTMNLDDENEEDVKMFACYEPKGLTEQETKDLHLMVQHATKMYSCVLSGMLPLVGVRPDRRLVGDPQFVQDVREGGSDITLPEPAKTKATFGPN